MGKSLGDGVKVVPKSQIGDARRAIWLPDRVTEAMVIETT